MGSAIYPRIVFDRANEVVVHLANPVFVCKVRRFKTEKEWMKAQVGLDIGARFELNEYYYILSDVQFVQDAISEEVPKLMSTAGDAVKEMLFNQCTISKKEFMQRCKTNRQQLSHAINGRISRGVFYKPVIPEQHYNNGLLSEGAIWHYLNK